MRAIFGNAVAPGLVDCYLARDGYEAQQTDRPLEGDRPGNLFEPVPGDQDAHGPFDDRSRSHSVELFARTHGALLGGLAAASTLALVAGARIRR